MEGVLLTRFLGQKFKTTLEFYQAKNKFFC